MLVAWDYSPLLYLFIYSSHNPPRPTIVSELAEIDTLPRTEVEPSVGDGDAEADAKERTLGMGRHVVGTLQHMVVVRLALPDDVVHDFLHIRAHVGVGILIDT